MIYLRDLYYFRYLALLVVQLWACLSFADANRSKVLETEQVVIVSGILSKDGTFKLSPLEVVSSGRVSEDRKGNFRVLILDASGRSLYSTSYSPSFKMLVSYGGSQAVPKGNVPELENVPVLLRLPHLKKGAKIIIKLDDQVIAEAAMPER